jgi:hypothetical protein
VQDFASESRRIVADFRQAVATEPSDASMIGEQPSAAATDKIAASADYPPRPALVKRRRSWAAILLVGLGFIFLASNFGLFRWINWDLYWPTILIVTGGLLLARSVRN